MGVVPKTTGFLIFSILQTYPYHRFCGWQGGFNALRPREVRLRESSKFQARPQRILNAWRALTSFMSYV